MILPIPLRGIGGSVVEVVDAVVDTGFTDELLVPRRVIERLELVRRGETLVGLGDGSLAVMAVFEMEIEWDSEWKTVKAYEGIDDALIGVSLLKSHCLSIDFVVGGEVRIEAL